MKKVNETLKMIGVFTVTGVMAVAGFVLGSVTFNPENVHITSNKK